MLSPNTCYSFTPFLGDHELVTYFMRRWKMARACPLIGSASLCLCKNCEIPFSLCIPVPQTHQLVVIFLIFLYPEMLKRKRGHWRNRLQYSGDCCALSLREYITFRASLIICLLFTAVCPFNISSVCLSSYWAAWEWWMRLLQLDPLGALLYCSLFSSFLNIQLALGLCSYFPSPPGCVSVIFGK